MAIAFVRNTLGGGTTPLNQNLSYLPVAGNLLVVGIGNNSNILNSITSITDSAVPANVYTRATSDWASGYSSTELWYAKNIVPASGIHNLTVTSSIPGTTIQLAINEYSGIDVSSPLDQTAATETASSATINAGPTGTTTVNDELVVMVGSQQAAATLTVGAGYSNFNQATGVAPVAIQSKVVASTGTQSGTMATSITANVTGLIATFKA